MTNLSSKAENARAQIQMLKELSESLNQAMVALLNWRTLKRS